MKKVTTVMHQKSHPSVSCFVQDVRNNEVMSEYNLYNSIAVHRISMGWCNTEWWQIQWEFQNSRMSKAYWHIYLVSRHESLIFIAHLSHHGNGWQERVPFSTMLHSLIFPKHYSHSTAFYINLCSQQLYPVLRCNLLNPSHLSHVAVHVNPQYDR